MRTILYIKTVTVSINCSYNCFAPVYINMTANTKHSSTPTLCIATYHFSRNSIKSFFQINKTKIELFSFSSKLLHLSYNKNDISGSFTFHKSKLNIIYINLLPNSVFEDPFHHFHSMFQQFNSSIRCTLHWITFPFVSWNATFFHKSSIH